MPPLIKAVVLDLDDTLIDTTSQLVGPAHTEAAAAMIAAGLSGGLEEVARKRLALARAHPRESVDALVASYFGCDDVAVVRAGHDAFYNRKVTHLEPFEDSIPVLQELGSRGTQRLLLTVGHPGTQRQKIELAGLGPHVDEVVIVDSREPDKEPALVRLLVGRSLDPTSVVVIGDRIDREIAAARRLGCWAVRVDHGEGRFARPASPEEQPHYTVPGIGALPAVIHDIEEG